MDPPVRQHSFVEMCHEIISTAILSLALIQAGQLSVTGEKDLHIILVNCLGLSLSRKVWFKVTDCLDITLGVNWDVK